MGMRTTYEEKANATGTRHSALSRALLLMLISVHLEDGRRSGTAHFSKPIPKIHQCYPALPREYKLVLRTHHRPQA